MAAQTLVDFLADNPVGDITEEVVISNRLKNFKFKVKPYTSEDYERYTKRHRKIGRKGKVEFNETAFFRQIVIENTLYPEFSDAKMLKEKGCQTPDEFVIKFLKPGEIHKLGNIISELSGFDDDINDLAEEAKN